MFFISVEPLALVWPQSLPRCFNLDTVYYQSQRLRKELGLRAGERSGAFRLNSDQAGQTLGEKGKGAVRVIMSKHTVTLNSAGHLEDAALMVRRRGVAGRGRLMGHRAAQKVGGEWDGWPHFRADAQYADGCNRME